MTRLTTLAATAILSIMAATPALAQSTFAQQEPAAFAAMHPNASVYSYGYSPTDSMGAMAYLPPGHHLHIRRTPAVRR